MDTKSEKDYVSLMVIPKQHEMAGRVITLRAVIEKDYVSLGEVLNDRETMSALIPYFKTEHWSPEMVKERYETFQKTQDEGKGSSYAVVVNRTGRVVGNCGFNNITPTYAEFGLIIHRSVWGTGVAIECFLLCFQYGFEALGLSRIYCTTDNHNIRMKKFFDKIGIPFLRTTDENYLYYELEAGNWPKVQTIINSLLS